jgi:hypothetical protein
VESLTFAAAVEVEKAFNQATGYAYGQQDAAGENDTQGAAFFAHMYREHVRRYKLEQSGTMNNLRSAWKNWKASNGGSVEDDN